MSKTHWGGVVPLWAGPPSAEAIAGFCRAAGVRRPMLVSGAGFAASPERRDLVHALEAAGVAVCPFDQASSPALITVAEAVAAYHLDDCDGLVAAGGGTVLDVAKVAALMVGQNIPLGDLASEAGADAWTRAMTGVIPPLLAVPTTVLGAAALGASAWIVDEAGRTRLVRHPRLRPALAVVDAALIAAVPDGVAARSATALVRLLDDEGIRPDAPRDGVGAVLAAAGVAGALEAGEGWRRRLAPALAYGSGIAAADVLTADLEGPGCPAYDPSVVVPVLDAHPEVPDTVRRRMLGAAGLDPALAPSRPRRRGGRQGRAA